MKMLDIQTQKHSLHWTTKIQKQVALKKLTFHFLNSAKSGILKMADDLKAHTH